MTSIVKQQNTIMNIVDKFTNLPVAQCRGMFERLEKALLKLPQITAEDYQLKEFYSGGLYCRQITIPKGALITGRIYKFDHIEMMLSGEIEIVSADGGKKTYTGTNVIAAKSGKRQAGLAIKETVWMTINQVPANIPIHEMLDYTAVLTYEEYNEFYRNINKLDYAKFLNETGLTQEQMDKQVMVDDVVDMPLGYEHIITQSSSLEGVGLFTKKNIKKGAIICPARVLVNRTIAGRYANHALYSNSIPYQENDIFYFVANTDINKGDEITANYRDIINYRNLRGDL